MTSRRVKEVRADNRRAIEGGIYPIHELIASNNIFDYLGESPARVLDPSNHDFVIESPLPKEILVIKIPALPPREFNQNARVHWYRKHEAGKFYKELVFGVLLEKSEGWEGIAPLASARMKVIYHLATKAVMDQDNAISRLKPAIDGLVASGLFTDDDKITIVEPVEFEKVEKGIEPWLELQLIDYRRSIDSQT